MPARDPTKASLSVRIDVGLLARARVVARDLAGKPHYLTLAALVEGALREHVERYERVLDDPDADPMPDRLRPSRNSHPADRR